MDVLSQYTNIRCAVETNIPDEVLASLRKNVQLRRVLDEASDDVAVLKAKSLIVMEDFAKAKDQCPLLKVPHPVGHEELGCGCDKKQWLTFSWAVYDRHAQPPRRGEVSPADRRVRPEQVRSLLLVRSCVLFS